MAPNQITLQSPPYDEKNANVLMKLVETRDSLLGCQSIIPVLLLPSLSWH